MKNKFLIASVAAIGTLAIAVGVFASTSLPGNNFYQSTNRMHRAMLNGDYSTWRATANHYGTGRMMGNISPQRFSRMQQMMQNYYQNDNDNVRNYVPQNINRGYGMMRGNYARGYGMMGF